MALRDPRSNLLLQNLPEEDGCKRIGWCLLIEEASGYSGIGVVYRAYHSRLQIQVAIRVLTPATALQFVQASERIQGIAELAASVSSPNVIRVLDIGEENGLHYIVTEYVDGENARERMARQGRLSIGEVLTIALGAARGLAAAHRCGIVHHDLNPSSVMIAKDGRVLLADLGLASSEASELAPSINEKPIGMSVYMPPERLLGRGRPTVASDVYSLGATLYFLLAGKNELESVNLVGARDHSFPDPRTVRSEVPDGLASIIKQCTCTDPYERPRDVSEVVAQLEALQGIRPSSAAAGPTDRLSVRSTAWIALIPVSCATAALLEWINGNPPSAILLLACIFAVVASSIVAIFATRRRRSTEQRLFMTTESRLRS